MRIAVVAPPWYEVPPDGYGGIELVCFHLVRGLADLGHDVTLVGAGSTGAGERFVRTSPKPAAELGQTGSALPEIIHAARTERALDELEVDVVHDHSLAGPLTAKGSAAARVITAHGPVAGELGHYYRSLPSEVGIVAISEAQRRSGPDLPWVGTVHNAVALAEQPFRASKDEFVAFLGRMSPDKGAHLAIEAARASGRRLVMAAKCSEEDERRYFEQEVEPRIGSDTEWVEEADAAQKTEILTRARCLVAPIQWEEPFGMVMIEAMACGTPVVALRRGSVPEVVEDGVTGFIRDDPSELPEAIDRAGEIDPYACRDRVARLFDVPVMASAYESVFRKLLEGSGGQS